MREAKNVPAEKKIVTQVVEVPGGSSPFSFLPSSARALERREVRREIGTPSAFSVSKRAAVRPLEQRVSPRSAGDCRRETRAAAAGRRARAADTRPIARAIDLQLDEVGKISRADEIAHALIVERQREAPQVSCVAGPEERLTSRRAQVDFDAAVGIRGDVERS